MHHIPIFLWLRTDLNCQSRTLKEWGFTIKLRSHFIINKSCWFIFYLLLSNMSMNFCVDCGNRTHLLNLFTVALEPTQLRPHINKKIRTFNGSDFLLTLKLSNFLYFRVRHSSEPWLCDQNLKEWLCLLKFLMISKFFILLFIIIFSFFTLFNFLLYIIEKMSFFSIFEILIT